jgi:hypothetical protein
MLKRNIHKIFTFVILVSSSVFLFACDAVSSNNASQTRNVPHRFDGYKQAKVVGTISSDEINESSGLTSSPCQPEVLWTHNDSGDKAFIYALDKTGKKLATFIVSGAENIDWEDIAIRRDKTGACFLYLADTGNNEQARSELTIYKVREPKVDGSTNSSRKNPLSTERAEAIKFEYPDSRHDAETLLVHPETGDIYIITKHLTDAAGIYKLKADYEPNKKQKPKKIAEITVPAVPNGFLTGGAISFDGKSVVLCDYLAAYELTLPKEAKNFDDIWNQKPQKIETGERKQGEAVTYSADDRAIYLTSEKKNSPLIMIERNRL